MSQIAFALNTDVATSIQNTGSLIANLTKAFIVSPTNAPPGVNGYVFDVIDDEEVSLNSDITDSYIETNTAIQDHIALRPVKFSLHGFVGELASLLITEEEELVGIVQQLLSPQQLLPNWNAQDFQFYSQLIASSTKSQEAINALTSAASLISQLIPTLTQQQQAYATFYGFWSNRVLCTIQTPYGLLTNMAIESVRALQTGQTRIISDFQVTFKQIKQIGLTASAPVGDPNPAGPATQFSPQATTQGITNPDPTTNFPTQITNGVTNANSSGVITDSLYPSPPTPGASNGGVSLDPDNKSEVSLDSLVLNNGDLITTLPPPVYPPPVAPKASPVLNGKMNPPPFNSFTPAPVNQYANLPIMAPVVGI